MSFFHTCKSALGLAERLSRSLPTQVIMRFYRFKVKRIISTGHLVGMLFGSLNTYIYNTVRKVQIRKKDALLWLYVKKILLCQNFVSNWESFSSSCAKLTCWSQLPLFRWTEGPVGNFWIFSHVPLKFQCHSCPAFGQGITFSTPRTVTENSHSSMMST